MCHNNSLHVRVWTFVLVRAWDAVFQCLSQGYVSTHTLKDKVSCLILNTCPDTDKQAIVVADLKLHASFYRPSGQSLVCLYMQPGHLTA